jgi:hypothetical protein
MSGRRKILNFALITGNGASLYLMNVIPEESFSNPAQVLNCKRMLPA